MDIVSVKRMDFYYWICHLSISLDVSLSLNKIIRLPGDYPFLCDFVCTDRVCARFECIFNNFTRCEFLIFSILAL